MENTRTSIARDLDRPVGSDAAMDGLKSWSRRTLLGSLKAKLVRSRPSVKDIVDPARDEESHPQTPSSKHQAFSLGSLSRSKRRQRASVLDSPTARQEFQDGSPHHKRNTSKSDAIKRFAASSIGRRTGRDAIIMMNASEEQRSASTVASEAPSVDVDIPTGGLGSYGEKEYDLFSDTASSSAKFSRRGALLHNDVHVQHLYPPAPIEVHHSSPVPVRCVKRDSAICLLPLPTTESSLDGSEVITPEETKKSEFIVGSVPNPTPMITWAAHLPTRQSHARHHLGKLDLSTATAEAPQALPTPMPGTILPLEDPFEDLSTVPNKPCATHASEFSTDSASRSPKELSAQTSFNEKLQALKNPDAGHVDHNTGLWESNDPFARGEVDTLSGASAETCINHYEPVLGCKPQPSSTMSAQTVIGGAMHQIISYIPSECVTASLTNGYNVSKSLPIAHDTDPSSRAAASIKYLESEADRRARWAELLYEWQRRHRGDMSGLSLGATMWMDELKDPAYATMKYFDDANSIHDSTRPSRYAESWPNGVSHDAKVRKRNAKVWKDLANGKYDANGVRIRKPKPRVEEKPKPRPKGKYVSLGELHKTHVRINGKWVWKSEFAVAETPKRKVVTRKGIKENYVQVGPMWIHKSNFFLEEMPEATNTKNGAGLEENLDNVTTEEPMVSDEAPRFNDIDWQSAADR